MGFFDKLKKGLEKTHENIFAKVDKLINYKSEVDDDFLDQLEEILLSSDVGVQTTEIIIDGTLYLKGDNDRIYDRDTEQYLGTHNLSSNTIDFTN